MKDLEEDGIGSGLRFFPPNTPATSRRRRYLFLAAWGLISAMLIWPIYPFFAAGTPLILGLPQSFAWVLLAMVLMFGALFWLFLGEERDAKAARRRGSSDRAAHDPDMEA